MGWAGIVSADTGDRLEFEGTRPRTTCIGLWLTRADGMGIIISRWNRAKSDADALTVAPEKTVRRGGPSGSQGGRYVSHDDDSSLPGRLNLVCGAMQKII